MDQTTRSLQTTLFSSHAPVMAPATAPLDDHRVEELALRASGLGVWVLDLLSREFRTSDRFREILAQQPSGSAGKDDWSDLFELVHPEERDNLYQEMVGQLDGVWPLDIEVRLRVGAREYRWYRLAGNSLLDDDGIPLLIAGTIEDVNERRRVDEAVRNSEATLRRLTEEMQESEERFRQLAEHMEDMFWLEDSSNGEAIYANPALTRILRGCKQGLSCCTGDCWRSIAHPDDAGLAMRLGSQAENRKTDITFRILGEDGTTRWLHARTFPIYDALGEPYRLAGIAQDVTEAKRAQDLQRESQKLESIGQLAAGVAHEINTPIQYISDNLHFLDESAEALSKVARLTQTLARGGADSRSMAADLATLAELMQSEDIEYVLDELPKAIAQALDGAAQVTRIVRAMKEFSHPGDPDEAVPVDINKTIESATVVCRNEWKYCAELELQLADGLPDVLSFPGSLGQVIVNLIINASHAIYDVVGDSGSMGKITIRTRAVDGSVEIAIEDTGSGIPEEIRNRVFDPFFTSKEVGKGTGQGLSLAWATIVDRHAGSLTLESEVGKGTTFFIRMPAEKS